MQQKIWQLSHQIWTRSLAPLLVCNASQSQKTHRSSWSVYNLLQPPSSVHNTKIRPWSLAPLRVRNTSKSRKIHRRSWVRNLLRPPSSVHKTKNRPWSLALLQVRNTSQSRKIHQRSWVRNLLRPPSFHKTKIRPQSLAPL